MRNMRFPCLTALLAVMAITTTTAQTSCPRQTTQHVAETISRGPAQDCGGADIEIIEVGARVDAGRCPTWMVYTPPHDIAVTATTETYVEVLQTLPITMVTFECTTRWLLFLPIGSSCKASQPSTVGAVYSMLARPCPPARV